MATFHITRMASLKVTAMKLTWTERVAEGWWRLIGVAAVIGAMPFAAVSALADTPVQVETAEVRPLVRTIELTGTVTSPRVSKLSTLVPGLVSEVHFDSGAAVEAGTMLLKLDSRLEEIALDEIDAQERQARAELADAHRRLAIAEDLSKREHGTRNEVDARKTEVAIDGAVVDRLAAQKANIAERIDRHLVKAPFSGSISQRMAEVGQWVQPGDPVFELVDLKNLRIDVPVPQRHFSDLQTQPDIRISFDAIQGETFAGRIDAVIPVSDPSARTFTLRVLPELGDGRITPGMSARVEIGFAEGKRGLVISQDALVRHPDGRISVWVVQKNGNEHHVSEHKVEIGVAFQGVVHVLAGIAPGAKVVVRGNESLREGQTVRLSS